MVVKIILCVCVACIIGLIAFQFIDPNLNSNNNTTLVDDPNRLSIGISGEVSKPGDYVFDSSPTMEDLIGAAGGITTNGADRCFYYEAKIEANKSYYIPPKYDNSNICSNDPIEKVNINTASKEELMTISGFGEALSTSVISYREENGTFYTLEDLMNVDGIGNAKFNTCKNYIILHD